MEEEKEREREVRRKKMSSLGKYIYSTPVMNLDYDYSYDLSFDAYF